MKPKSRWYHWVLAVSLVAVGSLGFADPAQAVDLEFKQARAAVVVSTLPPQQERFRKCVAHRESRNNPRAQNKRSSAQGTYQFLDSQWRRGLAHMVTAALRDRGVNVKGLKRELRSTPIKRWDPLLQDVAFAEVLNARGKWSGWKHWYLAGSTCNALVVR